MSYCRFCGTEIAYKRTKNYKWMPCNLLTGEPHFCQEGKDKFSSSSGLIPCPICGKATFSGKEGVEMPVGIGMSSYLQKLWKEGKL